MVEQLIRQLEEAAQIILTSSNLVSAEQRQSAEAVFLNFRKTKCPYQLCQQILETNNTDYILFESAGLIKIALVKEWTTLSEEDISSLRQYLLQYVISKPNMAPYVRGRILQVIAIIIKRSSINDLGQETRRILEEIKNLIENSDMARQVLGCSIISAIMQEYATDDKSADINLKWEVHMRAKTQFECSDLKNIFKFCIKMLGELIQKDINEDTLGLLKHLLQIAEGVLVWTFRTNFGSPKIETFYNPTLRLDTNWEDVMLDPAVLDLFFTLYWKVRSSPQLGHHAMTCLERLATLHGTIMSSKEQVLHYISGYMQRFLKLITSIDILDQEAPGIANIITTIVLTSHRKGITLPEDILKLCMVQISRLTCLFIERAAQEEYLCADDNVYTEPLEIMFGFWSIILMDINLFPVEFCKQSSIQIFNIYLRCHLSVPEGVRGNGEKDCNEEDIDTEEDDKIRYKVQLQTIGTFGRQVLSHSLPLLAQLIEDRTSKLRENLNKFVGQIESNDTTANNSMSRLYEDIHWLLLVTGHVLCMEADGEVALMPSEIIRYSMEQERQGKVDANLTLQLLASSQNIQSDINGATESIDPVIRLIADIFRLCAIEKTAISMHLERILSPELSCTIIWFLQRYSLSYFLPVEDNYSEIGTTILQAFGEDSPGALWTMNYFLEKIEYNIMAFKSEPALAKETIQLLLVLVDSPKKVKCLMKSEQFGRIIDLGIKEHGNFPQVVKRGLMRAIIPVGIAVENLISQQCYWSQTLQVLQDRCKQIISNENFMHSYHQEEIKMQIIDILECYVGLAQGVAQGARLSTYTDNLPKFHTIFQYMCPVFVELPKLLALYYNYQVIIQLILELLCESTEGIFHCLEKADGERILKVCMETIENYKRCNTNRLTVDSTAEEDSFQDILLLMQFLTNTMDRRCTEESWSIEPTDVIFSGLNTIMPIMTTDLLKFPTLCLEYYKMIRLVCYRYPEKVCALSADLLQQLLASVELGLFSFGHEVTEICCDLIKDLAVHIYDKSKKTNEPRNQLIVPFLNLIMTVTLSQDCHFNIGGPLYYLICCYQEQYLQFVQNILSAQTDEQIGKRLADAFATLTEGIQFDLRLIQKLKFKKNYNMFVVNVQGFLMVK